MVCANSLGKSPLATHQPGSQLTALGGWHPSPTCDYTQEGVGGAKLWRARLSSRPWRFWFLPPSRIDSHFRAFSPIDLAFPGFHRPILFNSGKFPTSDSLRRNRIRVLAVFAAQRFSGSPSGFGSTWDATIPGRGEFAYRQQPAPVRCILVQRGFSAAGGLAVALITRLIVGAYMAERDQARAAARA